MIYSVIDVEPDKTTVVATANCELGVARGVRVEEEAPTTTTVSPAASVVRDTTVVLDPVPSVMGWPGARV